MPPKKAAKHHDDKHHRAKDLRRAFEHLGRVEILRRILNDSSAALASLIHLAQTEVDNGSSKNAADLLRAAEHLAFAFLLNHSTNNTQMAGGLDAAVREEFDRIEEKAEERWSPEEANPEIARLYGEMRQKAKIARKEGAYRQALELIRGAEALAHVTKPSKPKKQTPKKLAARSNVRELAAS